MTSRQCAEALRADARMGLTREEAERRLLETGRNELPGAKKRGLVRRFLAQLSDFMVLILLAAAAVSFVAAKLDGSGDAVDSIVILAIVLVNAATGMIQESRAEKAMESLRRMSSPKARRRGRR